MALDWWTVGGEWRVRHSSLAHGDLVREAAKAAHDAGLAPNTLRAAKAAVEFVSALERDGLIDERQRRSLARLSLKAIGVLQRVARHGTAELEGLLGRLTGPRPPTGDALAVLEAEVRARRRPLEGPEANAHGYRLMARAFRAAVLQALEAEAATTGGRIFRPVPATQVEPFVVDAISRRGDPASYSGYRLLAETAGTKIRPRLAEAVPPAMAAARAFDAVVLVAQAPDDAEELAERIRQVGDCGVGVARFEPVGRLVDVLTASRRQAPDLAARYADDLASRFPVPEEEITTGRISHASGGSP